MPRWRIRLPKTFLRTRIVLFLLLLAAVLLAWYYLTFFYFYDPKYYEPRDLERQVESWKETPSN